MTTNPGEISGDGDPGSTPDSAGQRSGFPVRVVAVVVGLGALAAVAYGVVQATSGESGGSASPEAAVQEMAAAITAEDPLGLLATLSPTEVMLASDAYAAAEAASKEAGLAGSSATFSGVNLEVVDLELSVEELTDSVAQVTIEDFTLEWSLDPDEMADTIASGLRDEDTELEGEVTYDDVMDWYTEAGEGDDDRELAVITVREGGGWYVSPVYTAGEMITTANDYPTGDFSAIGDGARDAPKDAAALAVSIEEALEASDPMALADHVAFDSLGLHVVYEEALSDLIKEVEDDEGRDLDELLEFEIDELEVSEQREGDLTFVTLESVQGEMTGTDRYDDTFTTEFEFDGECLDWRSEDDYSDDEGEICIDDRFGELTGIDSAFLVAVQQNGGLRISPAATMFEYARRALTNADQSVVLRALDLTHLGPVTAEVELGEPTEIELTEAGTAMIAVELEEGDFLSFGAHGDIDEMVLVDPSGEEASWCWQGDGYACTYDVELDGEHRFVLNIDEWEPQEIEVGVHVLEPEEISLPADITIEDRGTGEAAVYLFEADSDAVEVLDGDEPPTVYIFPVSDEISGTGWSGLEVGEDYLLVVNDPGDYEFTFGTPVSEPSGGGDDEIMLSSGDLAAGEYFELIVDLAGSDDETTLIVEGTGDLVVEVFSADGELLEIIDDDIEGGYELVYLPAPDGDTGLEYTLGIYEFSGVESSFVVWLGAADQ